MGQLTELRFRDDLAMLCQTFNGPNCYIGRSISVLTDGDRMMCHAGQIYDGYRAFFKRSDWGCFIVIHKEK